MKYNTNRSLTSSNPLKFFQNRGNSERLSDSAPNNQNKAAISRITVNFGINCQNDANFAARVGLGAAQNPNTHQKTTAIKARRGFTLCN